MEKYEKIEKVNVTPTWLQFLPMLLEIYPDARKKVYGKKHSPENAENYENIRSEFKKMAIAADNWNAYCAEMNEKKGS